MRDDVVRPWWQTAVIYEIYVRSFQDGDGDGVGDLAGIATRIDHLAALGVDAVWLTPFFASPMADGGYDVADYCAVDPLFGTLGDFDALVAALKACGIRTILDLVPNHTSSDHPWFVASRTARTSPYRDWYIWRDPAPDGGPPNNWMSQNDRSAWNFDPATGQCYLHSFLPEQPDLNWRNGEVRAAIYEAMRFWLRRGIDGFRVDVLQGLLKDPAFRDDPPNPRFALGAPAFTKFDQTNSSNQPDVVGIAAEMRAVLAEFPGDPVLIGEIYRPVETLVEYYGPDLSGAHLPFNFNLFFVPWQAGALLDLIRRYEAALPAGAWPNWVLGNHDIGRVASRLGPAQARVAMVLILTLRGTPTLYQGDELGMTDVAIPADRVRDAFAAFGPGRGRDAERAPMPWSADASAGFSTGEPWLPLPEPGHPAPADVQADDPGSMLSLARALLALRRREPALAGGRWIGISAGDGVLVYDRLAETDEADGAGIWRVALNLRPEAALVAGFGSGTVAVSTHDAAPPRIEGPDLALRPDEAVVVRLDATG